MTAASAAREGHRVLVVDDDPNVVALVRASLDGEDLQIGSAGSFSEGISRIGSDRPDLILLDVVLPDENGLEALKLLRERGVETPVIVITSHASMQVAIEAMKEGAYDFLTKPIRPATLNRLVTEVLAEEEADAAAAEPVPAPEPGRMEEKLQIVGKSPAIVEVYKTIGRVAQTNATVLVVGESGTGKELVSRVLHRNSRRSQGPFLAINCAAIPENLLESELFGHEKGAFTGAVARTMGKFERARGGTLFLDEIGDMSLSLQAKLLRVLEQKEVERVGGSEAIPVDVRIVAASNQDLEGAVEEGEFREDLYYRLAVVTIELPPLRQRGDDIRLLADYFIRQLSGPIGRNIERVEPDVYERLQAYKWPGNVRELRNFLERSLILGRGPVLRARALPSPAPDIVPEAAHPPTLEELVQERASLEEVERRYILELLQEMDWNYTAAAEVLDIHRNTLRRKINRYGIERPD